MLIAVVLVLLVFGSILFHFLSPWWFTPIASNWTQIDTTVNITFWVTGFVFVVVNLFLAYVCVRYRYSPDRRAHYEPENKKLEWGLTAFTGVGVAAMLAPGLLVWGMFVDVPDDAHEIEAVAEQWRWSFRMPGEDGIFGQTDVRYIDVDNPFGMDPSDPNGADDLLVNDGELHLPLNQPVKVLLRSKDVLHNFTVPQIRVKMDMVPGMVTYLWFEPTRTGKFEIMCEELCGLAHFAMRGRMVVDEAEDYQAWLSEQTTYQESTERVAANPLIGQAQYALCSACHGAQGEGNEQLGSPKITGQSTWYMLKQLQNFKEGHRGSAEGDIFGSQMAAMMVALADDSAMRNVIAYVQSLPDNPAPQSVEGNIDRGRRYYGSCKACHGVDGMGIWSQNGPRLTGMSDWYMVTQLQNFKSGMRGYHPMDFGGNQMTLLSVMLSDDQAINDVVAYINTLTPPNE